MEQEKKTYLSGFNCGYRLTLYTPELFDKIKASLNEKDDYDKGLLEGALQADKERGKSRLQELDGINRKKGYEQDRHR